MSLDHEMPMAVASENVLNEIKNEIDMFLNKNNSSLVVHSTSNAELQKLQQRNQRLEELLKTKEPSNAVLSNKKRKLESNERRLQHELSVLEANLEAKDIELDGMRARHENQIRELENENNRLNRTLSYISAEEQSIRKALGSIEASHKEKLRQLNKTIKEATKSAQFYENLALEWKDKALETEQANENDAEIHGSQMKRHRAEVDQVRKTYENKINLMNKKHRSQLQVLEAELQLEKINREDAQRKLETASDLVEQAQEMRSLREECMLLQSADRQHVREIEKLKKIAQRASIQQEEIDQLKHQLEASHRHCQELLKLNAEHEYSQKENEQWKTMLASTGAASNVMDMVEKEPCHAAFCLIKEKQMEERRLIEEKGTISLALKRMEIKLNDSTQREQASATKCVELEANVEDLTDKLENISRGYDLLKQNYDNLEDLMKTYENELPQASIDRTKQLEESLNDATNRIKELQQRLVASPSPAGAKKRQQRLDMLEAELSRSKQECSKVTQALERTERELAALESRFGKGEYDPSKTKVLHLAKSSESSNELKALRSENKQLKDELNKYRGTNLLVTPTAGTESQVGTPHETVSGLKMLNKRLKEVFREQIKRYREAVYLLTGYSIELRAEHHLLRLRSVYAEHQEDELLFQMVDDSLVLKETPLCTKLDRKIFAYLDTCHSIPAFLSTLTLHLFEQQTFQG